MYALSTPPAPSIASATSTAVGRFGVPLNIMCSRKWAIPLMRSASPRDPAPTKRFTLTDCADGIGVVTTRRPSASWVISGVTGMGPLLFQFAA